MYCRREPALQIGCVVNPTAGIQTCDPKKKKKNLSLPNDTSRDPRLFNLLSCVVTPGIFSHHKSKGIYSLKVCTVFGGNSKVFDQTLYLVRRPRLHKQRKTAGQLERDDLVVRSLMDQVRLEMAPIVVL